MKNEEIYKIWTDFINSDKYKIYFLSNEDSWKLKLNEVKIYIDRNNKLPSAYYKNKGIKRISKWIDHQITNYNTKKYIMLNEEIYKIWTEFINSNNYKEYFISNEDKWKLKLNEIKIYIDKNNKLPSTHDKNEEIKSLGRWISVQQKNYKSEKEIMSNNKIYKIWTDFINSDKYKEYLISNEDNWKLKLNKVKTYIDTNNKLPSTHDKNKEIKSLGQWICNQKRNYKTKKQIMSNEEIYKIWTDFINSDKYKKYIITS